MAPNNVPSNLSRALMNLFIGMCKGVAGLPRDLHNLAYGAKWIEYGFTNAQGEQVVPELIIASRQLGHAILWEWKSGANTEAPQLRRYAGVTTADLRERAFLAVEETATHDVAIVGLQQHAERLGIGIIAGPYPFPLVLATAIGLQISLNRFVPDQTDRIFRPLEIDWDKVPHNFFPVDADSELWEFAELLIPKVLELMGNGETRILLRQLEEAIPCWHLMAGRYQGQIRAKIHEVMHLATERQFEPYLRANRGGARGAGLGPHWDVINNPISHSSDRRAQEWKRMGSLHRQFLEFMQTGRVVPEQQQLDLRPAEEAALEEDLGADEE